MPVCADLLRRAARLARADLAEEDPSCAETTETAALRVPSLALRAAGSAADKAVLNLTQTTVKAALLTDTGSWLADILASSLGVDPA